MNKNVASAHVQPFAVASLSRWRLCIGLAIVCGGIVAAVNAFYLRVAVNDPHMSGALLGGFMAALATALGTLPVLLSQQFSQKTYDSMLGFGAGVMLAACSFSLVIPALASAKAQGASAWGSGSIVSAGILIGAGFLMFIGRAVPCENFARGLQSPQAKSLKRVWLFVLAICLHNLPEGLAIGVAFAGSDPTGATALATGIAIQDVPEGLVVALALRSVGYGRGFSAGLGVLSGLVEPLASVFGVVVIGISESLLPWGLAAAAGAMLYVISHEIIPEAHRKGNEVYATGGLMLGFVIMMLLDTALG